MERHTTIHSPRFYFWQYLLLSFLMGIVATRYFFPACFAFCALLLLMLHLHFSQGKSENRNTALLFCKIFLLSLSLGGGFFYAKAFESKINPQEQELFDSFNNPQDYHWIEGRIESAQGMVGQRLRLTLTDVIVSKIEDNVSPNVASVNNTKTQNQIQLPNKLALSIDKYNLLDKRPLRGESIQLRTKIRPTFGKIKQYYADQEIWYNAWQYGIKNLSLSGGQSFTYKLASLREDLRLSFARLLFQDSLKHKNTSAPESNHYYDENLSSIKNQAKAILMALIFGDKFYLSHSESALFNMANLSHSLALSGQHLALCVLVATGIFWLILYPLSYLKPYAFFPRRQTIFYLSIPLGFAYVFLGNAPYSLLRAFIMLCLMGFAWVKAKNFDLIDALFLALVCIVFSSPNTVFNLGVQLSFVCLFSLCLFAPCLAYGYKILQRPYAYNKMKQGKLYSHKHTDKNALKINRLQHKAINVFRYTIDLFIFSLIIQVCTLPLIIKVFGLGSYFFVLNVLWLPILATVVLPFAFLALLSLNFANLSQFFIDISIYPTEKLIQFLQYLDHMGFHPVEQFSKPTLLSILGYYLLLIIFCYCFIDRKKAYFKPLQRKYFSLYILCALSFCLLISGHVQRLFDNKDFTFHLVDVGQGQCIVMQTEKGNIVLDVGGSASPRFNAGRDILAHFLTDNAPPKIHSLLASHDDSDHINGMPHMIRYFDPQHFYENSQNKAEMSKNRQLVDKRLHEKNIQSISLGMGDILNLGDGYTLNVLYPPKEYRNKKATDNQSSLIIRLEKDDKGLALFCGDAEAENLEELLTLYPTQNLHTEILVLAHHGSKNSYSEAFYQAVKPKYVLASAGAYNRYNFPAQSIIDYFAKQKIEVWSTKDRGNLSFVHNGETWQYR